MAALPLDINLGLGTAINNLILLIVVILFTGTLAVVMIGVFYTLSFRIKATVFPVNATGNTNHLGVGKKKWQRFKWNKKKTTWTALRPLFNKKTIEPFSVEYIYSGNNIFALELPDKTYLPLKIDLHPKIGNKNYDLATMLSSMQPVPHYLRKWNEIELQQDEIEFDTRNFWEQNKHLIIAFVTIVLCLLLTGLAIYFTFKYAGGKFDVINSGFKDIVGSLKDMNTIPSK